MLAVSVLLITASSGASAQKMYRCGSVYQDRPCDAGVTEKVLRSSAGEAPSASTSKPAADPYCIKRGADARDTNQANCQRDRDSIAPFSAQGGGSYTPEAARDNTPSKAATSSSYNKCDYFKQQRESITSLERHGGSMQVMESLRQRRSSLEKSASAQGC